VPRGRRQVSGDEVAERAGEHGHEHRGRYRQGEEREGIGTALSAEASGRGRAGQVRYDDHPERLGGEHEHEIDAVGGEEAVGLGRAPELLCEQRARSRRRYCEHDLREAVRAPRTGAACSEQAEVHESHRGTTLL
jgi:hypothetical protein